jgi:sugar lactone lactonase YvrE
MAGGRLIAEEIATGFGFLEGPRWHDGSLWVSDFHRHLVFRIDPELGSADVVCEVPNDPSGLGFTSAGDMFVVSMNDRALLKLNGSELEVFADLSGFTPHPANDLVIDSHDRMYVSSFGCSPWIDQTLHPAPIIRVDPDRSARGVSIDMTFPNGMVFSHDESKMYAADTFGCRLATYAVSPGGDLALESFYRFAPAAYDSMPTAWASSDLLPDGIAIDPAGQIWIANANGNNIAVYDPRGGTARVVPVDNLDDHVYAVAFDPGGTLYACVAPRVETWDIKRQFPSRLVRLVPPEAAESQAGLQPGSRRGGRSGGSGQAPPPV